ncbi:MAG: glycosyltransferase family 2 protein [Pseudomonadota bacterium]
MRHATGPVESVPDRLPRGWETSRAVDGQPRITVVVAVLNAATNLAQCLESVAGQTYPAIELIVIDGGSTDGSVDIIRAHSNSIAYWVSEPDRGVYDALNKGIAASTGDWICVIGADDFFRSNDALALLAPTLASCDADLKLVYASLAIFDGERELCTLGAGAWQDPNPRLTEVAAVPYPGLMHRRSWFDQYGLYDPSFKIAGDYELLLRGRRVERALFVPGLVTVGMRLGGVSNHSGTAFESLREVGRAHSRHDIRPGWLYVQKVRIHTLMRYLLQKLWGEAAMWRMRQWRGDALRKP